jgi:hypothetical protein
MSHLSAARRTYRECGVAEDAFERAVLGRIEKSARADLGYEASLEAEVRRSRR